MADFMSMILEKWDIVLIVICFNVGLTALHQILDKVKDKTSTDVDNKVDGVLIKYLPYVQKLIDWLTGNIRH